MSTGKNLKINIPLDNDGFITLKCPYCNYTFKLEFVIANKESVIILYCPYCGLQTSPNNFIPTNILKHAKTLVSNELKNIINDWTDNLGKNFKSNKYISFKKNKKIKIENPAVLYETDHKLGVLEVSCCNCKVKILTTDKLMGIYCPYCGVKSDGI